MKSILVALFLSCSFQALSSDELALQLLRNKMLCNHQEAQFFTAIENLKKDPTNEEYKKAFDVAIKESKVCLNTAKNILFSSSSCTDKVESLLIKNILCNKEKAWLEITSELYDRAPSINTHLDFMLAEEEYASCSETAYNFCK